MTQWEKTKQPCMLHSWDYPWRPQSKLEVSGETMRSSSFLNADMRVIRELQGLPRTPNVEDKVNRHQFCGESYYQYRYTL